MNAIASRTDTDSFEKSSGENIDKSLDVGNF